MAAFDRLVVAFNGKSIGACDQNEVRILAGVLHGADLLCHLGLRDDRLVVIVAATLGEDLVLQMASRSEEHTSELQSLMRSSYAVFCLKKKNKETTVTISHTRIAPKYN